jgi:hypothetical protein
VIVVYEGNRARVINPDTGNGTFIIMYWEPTSAAGEMTYKELYLDAFTYRRMDETYS